MSLVEELIPGIDNKLPFLNETVWLYLPEVQCNFKCQYCYLNRNGLPRGKAKHDTNFILPECIRGKNKWIVIYGGEVLTDKVLLYSLISEIRKRTPNTIIFSSNGLLLKDEDITFFENNNVKISLSYDGKYQKYRGPDVLQLKKDIIYKAISHNVIIGLNTVVHSKNYTDYKFDLPGIDIIHDYNYIYPAETETNKEFLFDNSLSEYISDEVLFSMKSLLLDISKLTLDQIVLKYPPSQFYRLEQLLIIYSKNYDKPSFKEGSFCLQQDCFKVDIYGKKYNTCGKGSEISTLSHDNKACFNCRYFQICPYKCPAYNFDKTQCKETYMYKIYEKLDSLLNYLKNKS